MSQQSYNQVNSGYPNGGPVQHPMSTQQYAQMAPAPQVSIRPSSGAWNPTDDRQLMDSRAQGMNWAPIQQTFFPTKTPNACRKRHERLMERKNADDWDGYKLEDMAKHYMAMRREIWSSLAAVTGEKWSVVEAKVLTSPSPHPLLLTTPTNKHNQCMTHGLKNLQTKARSCARRERLSEPSPSALPQPQHHHPHLASQNQNQGQGAYGGAYHTDDSGYADDLEGLEAESYQDHTDGASERSGSYGYQSHQHTGSAGSVASLGGMMPGMGGGGMGAVNGAGMNGQMMDTRTQYMVAGMGVHQGGGGGMLNVNVNGQQGQRLPSMDMGIDAIINRPSGGR